MKRKEKVLTLEEIKEKLVQNQTPNWIHSAPLFGYVPGPEGIKILPLTSLVEKGIVVLFLVDVADYTFELVMDSIERLKSIYAGLPWIPTIAIEHKYIFLRNPKFFDRYRHSKVFASIPIYYDHQGEWFERYKAEKEPKIVILHQGNEILNIPLSSDMAAQMMKAELQFQEALRIDDQGLPLLDVALSSYKRPQDKRILPARELILDGNWVQASDSVMSEDSNASLSFHFEGSHLRLVAVTHPNARENARFTVSFNDEPLPSAHYGPGTRLGDKGNAISEINRVSGITEIVRSSLELKGTIKLKFLNAVENPVIIYGFRTA